MPTIGAENTEAAAGQAASEQAVSVINIPAFVEIFYLRAVNFDSEFKRLAAWFYPKREFVRRIFTVHERSFEGLAEVVYTEDGNSVTVKASVINILVSNTGGSFQNNGKDLTGSMCFSVKMDPARFPKWAKFRNGILTFRLQNGRKHQFHCVY